MRDFRVEDQNQVRDLVLAGLRERWGDDYDPTFNPDLNDVASSYLALGADVLVIEDDGAIVAIGMLIPEEDRQARIVRMSVASTHRRRGLARSIVENLVLRAEQRGMHEVLVSTDTPWTSAVALYRSCGFEQIGQDETDTHFVLTVRTL